VAGHWSRCPKSSITRPPLYTPPPSLSKRCIHLSLSASVSLTPAPSRDPPQAASEQSQAPPTKAVLETAIGPHAPSLYRQRGPVQKVPPEVVIGGCEAVDAAAVAAYERRGYAHPIPGGLATPSLGTCALGSAA